MSREQAKPGQRSKPVGTSPRRSPKDRLIDELGEAFRIYGNAEQAFDNLAAQRLGVNRTDLVCLDIIQRVGSLTAGELAKETGLTTGAVTAVIDRLESAGLARRVRDSRDRRKVLVSGTEALERGAWEIWGPMKGEWDALMRKHTTAELKSLRDFIRESTEVFRRHAERLRDGE